MGAGTVRAGGSWHIRAALADSGASVPAESALAHGAVLELPL